MSGHDLSKITFRRRSLLATGGIIGLGVSIGVTPRAFAAPLVVEPRGPGEDSAPAIQEAVDSVGVTGGTVMLRSGVYPIGSTIRLASGVRLQGAGRDSTRLVDHPNLGARPLLAVEGTASATVAGVVVSDLGLRNGTAGTRAFMAGRDGIIIDRAEQISIERVRVTEIAGANGISAQRTAGLSITGSHFYRCTYAMVIILPDCTDVRVADCEFDTLTSTAYPNTYTFATGYQALNSGQRWTEGLLVENCVFLNNPRWEGLDTHGATDVIFRGNHIENVRIGILAGNAGGAVADPRLEDVVIEENTVIQGTGMPGHYGIVCTGNVARARNVVIRGNHVRGFSGLDHRVGTVNVFRADNVAIEGNTIVDYGMNAINLYYGVFGAKITGNRIRNLGLRAAGQPTAAINAVTSGCFGIDVRGNTVISDSPGQQPDFAISAHPHQSWQVGPNQVIGGTAVARYGGIDHLPVGKEQLPSVALQCRDRDMLLADDRRPAWQAEVTGGGFGSTDVETVVGHFRLRAGSREAEVLVNGSQDWTLFPPGMQIAIDGAAPSGSVLRTGVVTNSGTMSAGDRPLGPAMVTLADPAASDSESAPVRYGPVVLRPVDHG